MKKYFYSLLANYINLYVRPETQFIEVDPQTDLLSNQLVSKKRLVISFANLKSREIKSDFVLLNGNLHFERDIQNFLEVLHSAVSSETRLIVLYYSSLWFPFFKLATLMGFRNKTQEKNWFSPTDLNNFCQLSSFEIVNEHKKILIPFYIPIVSSFINRWIAPLPFFRSFTCLNIAVLRPVKKEISSSRKYSVSIVVPARNEAGNIENIVKRLPKMGENDELIFIEGNSTDNTWQEIQRVAKVYDGKIKIKIGQQEGKGKGDAVRKGFSIAEQDILMILDADITVPPEELPKFYKAIVQNTGEFINGSRLVYPMEDQAMRFFNQLGNKFFALAFSYVLNQPLKDTLCGTKVLTRENYLKVAANRSYFGDFDPFGDFDLLFGASRLGLKIIEVPITYKSRVYGDTNIQRWSHGIILLRMLAFAAKKIKFL